MLSDMVDSVIVLNDEHYKKNEFSQILHSKIKTDQKFKCKSKKRAACPKGLFLIKLLPFKFAKYYHIIKVVVISMLIQIHIAALVNNKFKFDLFSNWYFTDRAVFN